MVKLSLVSRFLQLRVSSCAVTILITVTVIEFFCSYGVYDFEHIPRESIPNALYKAVSPGLQSKPDRPDCRYDHILSSVDSINNWEVHKKYDDFSITGVVNGSYVPADCNPLFSVALVVPYRDRQRQLNVFMPYMHNFLRKQNIHYKIYLIEQEDNKPFNKGLLFNLGAQLAISEGFPCLVMHDVDVLPLVHADLQVCLHQPRHVSSSLDKFRFVLPYRRLVGGALALTADHYRRANGYSNGFLSWGGEDDDFADRIHAQNLDILRLGPSQSRHAMLMHPPAARGAARPPRSPAAADGLSSARATATRRKDHALFTLLAVQV